MDNWTKEILQKLDNGEELDMSIVREMVWNDVDRIEGENRRWSRSVQSIVALGDRYFAIDWEEGLTEMQENEFYDQPYEVKKIEKTVVVEEWVSIK